MYLIAVNLSIGVRAIRIIEALEMSSKWKVCTNKFLGIRMSRLICGCLLSTCDQFVVLGIHSEPIVDAGSSEYATQGTGGNNGFPQSFSNPGSACQPEPYFLGPPICSATCTTTTSAYSPTSCRVAGSSTRTVVSTDSSQENVVNTSMVHDNTTTTTSNSASCYTVMPGIEGELYLELPDPECFPASQDHNNSPVNILHSLIPV